MIFSLERLWFLSLLKFLLFYKRKKFRYFKLVIPFLKSNLRKQSESQINIYRYAHHLITYHKNNHQSKSQTILETCIILLHNITPINSIYKKEENSNNSRTIKLSCIDTLEYYILLKYYILFKILDTIEFIFPYRM